MQVTKKGNSTLAPPLASDALSARLAGTLELKKEQQNAHSSRITSVGFNHDGSQIVSGSDDETIKVENEWIQDQIRMTCNNAGRANFKQKTEELKQGKAGAKEVKKRKADAKQEAAEAEEAKQT